MARVSLKNIIGKNKTFNTVIQNLVTSLGLHIWIEDADGKILIGEVQENDKTVIPVLLNDETLGWVKGDEQGKIVAELLARLMEKDNEKKNLGAEVLNLYQEINVIFNFTETLTQTIEPDVIARLTLEQAIHSIEPHSGVIVLWDEHNKKLLIPAMAGEPLFDAEKIRSNFDMLLQIGMSGQSEIITDISQLKEKGIIEAPVQSIMYAAMKVKHRIMGAVILAGREAEQFSAAHLKLLVTLSLQSSAAIESALLFEKNIREAREREEAMLRIHEVTKKFVPNEFIRSLGKEKLTDVRLGDHVEKIVTVLFTDIRDFTTLSEKMTPEENFRFVSSFNSQLGPIIRSNNGFINQYLGDSIMAIFPDDPADAIRAAIKMQLAVAALNVIRDAGGFPSIHAGIGMHTGPLIMGITGDEQRMDAATISDTVNTAARIESLTKYYKSPLLLSQETIDRLDGKQHFNIRNLGTVKVKGKNNLLNIIECFDGITRTDFENKLKTLDSFNEAMDLYREKQFERSIPVFQSVLTINPDDLTVKMFLDKALKHHHEGVPENWTGAEEMMSK